MLLVSIYVVIMSLAATGASDAQPQVRDHRGQPQQKAAPANSGSTQQGITVCTPGVIITSACSTTGPKVRDHRKKK